VTASRIATARLQLPEPCDYPQLAEIVDRGLLADAIGACLAGAEPVAPALRACAVRKLHYKPRSGCRLVIEARFAAASGRSVEQLYFGRLLPGDQAVRSFEATDPATLAPPRFGPASLYLPAWQLLLWAYPNDPGLPGLPLLGDARRVLERLATSPAAFGLDRAPSTVTTQRAKYVPGKRCGYLYQVHGGSRPGRGQRARRIYGKCYAGDGAAQAHDVATRVWSSPARAAGRLQVPEPYACDVTTGIAWQEGLPGRPLLKQGGGAERIVGLAAEIGERLAALHGSSLLLPLELTHADQVAGLRRSLAAARALPAGPMHRLYELGERLFERATAQAEPLPVTLHGSFRLSHVMATRRGPAFIDLDGACSGDASVDLGRFAAHVLKLGAVGAVAQSTADAIVRELLAGYNAEAAERVSEERLQLSAAVHLVSGGLEKAIKRMDAGELDAVSRAAAGICPA
jgi:hypothetical protein